MARNRGVVRLIFAIAGFVLIGALILLALMGVIILGALFVVGARSALQLIQKAEQDGEL